MITYVKKFPVYIDGSGEIDEEYFDSFIKFIAYFVSSLYGKRHIKNWAEKNRGSSFIDMITSSEISYSIVLIENSKEVWDQEHVIR